VKRFWRTIHSFDYMGHKKWWFALSSVIIVAGLLSLFIRGGGNPADGLRYGLEFKSGTRIAVEFARPTTVAQVRAVVAPFDPGTPVIQSTGSGAQADKAFQIQTETLTPEKERQLRAALNKEFHIAKTADGAAYASQTVGASFGKDVITASWKAAIIALVLILIYISIRFEWKFAVAAVGAEIHDVLVVIGVYSITYREVTTASIAAVLTILGYSLYDTVIVFDRIRENAPRMRSMRYGDMVNRSIWETLTRSINTSLITLLPVVCLLIFGGATLSDFAFALLVGILSGAYSSIFFASPIATILKEREPQNRKIIARQREAKASSPS
jgi:SecD/SecF fusion protein